MISPIQFIQESLTELKKVTWPTRMETIRYTVVVIVISIGVGIFIGGTDMLFIKLSSLVFQK